MANEKKQIGTDPVYDAKLLGTPRMLILGFQHMFAMFGATVLVPIIVSGDFGLPLSVQTTLFFAGFGTIFFHLCTKLKVPAFLATLGWMMVVYGTNLLLCNKPPNNSQPLGGFLKNFTNLGSGNIAGIPIIVFFALGMCIIVHVLLTKTTLGREIFSVGSNAEAARVSGINVFKIQMITFALAGACYGLAGALEAARTGSANSSYGNGYEMDAIASCIGGGCSMTGGVGSVIGVFLGVIIFNVINYGLTFIGLSSYWQWVVKGLIIIIAVSIDMRKYSSNK